MHIRNATLQAEIRHLFATAMLAATLACLLPDIASAAALLEPVHSPAVQQHGVTRQLYLLPADDSPIQLQTHLAALNVTYHSDGSVSALVNADYHLKNESDDSITQPLVLYPGIGSALPQAVTLTAYGQALPLIATDGGGMTSQIDVPADSQVTVRLGYRVTVSGVPIVTVRYAPSVLRKWRGPTSTRIEVTLPDAIARESWTKVAPDTWTYDTAELGFTAIKWLYDSVVPDDEFIVQFVEPILWSEVQAAEATSASGGPAAAYLSRGDLYARLASLDSVDETVRDRFSAQAVAAYTEGIERSSDATTEDLARMHIGLATLYRKHAAEAGPNAASYGALMADEATAALAAMGTEDDRRVELQQWLADGLRTLFADARARGDWQKVSRVVDQMEELPPETVDNALIEEGRKIVLVQQALQLMRRGEQETAAELIGSDLPADAVAAPAELRPLYAAWHLTMTVKPDTVVLGIEALPAQGRQSEAGQQFETLAQAWQAEIQRAAASGSITMPAGNDDGSDVLQMRVEAPVAALHDLLATYVPGSSDFVFLRQTLSQLSPQTNEKTRFFQREVERRQPMDLQEAGDQWTAIAADIERRAVEIRNQADGAGADEQLTAEMRAANYRNTASEWRDLARDSWLRFSFESNDEASGDSRAWYATTTSAPVVFNVQTQTVDLSIVAGLLLSSLIGIAALSGILWWLL